MVSLAILGDSSRKKRPSRWGYALWGCGVDFWFPLVRLDQYNRKWAELEASTNPFATVVMAHLKTRATRQDPEDRFRWKGQLVRRLYEQGLKRKEMLELSRFIDWVMALPADLEQKLWSDIATYEAEVNMPYITSVERIGIQKGLEQGLREGEASLLLRLLRKRFQQLPEWVAERVSSASREDLERWGEGVFDADSPEALVRS